MAGKQQKNREEHDGVEGCFPCGGVKRNGGQLDHVASVRTRGGIPWAAGPANRVVQQPSKMPHAREQCAGMARPYRGIVPSRAHSPQVDPLCRACTACYARLEDRPLGVWVGEGLKEEIAGERGPRRPSQRRYDEKMWESSIDSPIDGTMVYLFTPLM